MKRGVNFFYFFFVLGIYLLCFLHTARSFNPDSKDLVLTIRQKDALTKFKQRMEPYLPITNEYMKTDIYLVKWLRATKFDIKRAEERLLQDLQWRDENSIGDALINEDFSDLQMDYSVNQTDEFGRPVLYMPIETWDVRKQVISGKGSRFERFIYKMLEIASLRVRELQDQGKQVTRFIIVPNLKGFTIQEQGCIGCIPVYLILVQAFEQHYPESMAKCAFVNTPSIFEYVLTALKSVMSEQLKNQLEIYGANRQSWPEHLRTLVDTIENELYK